MLGLRKRRYESAASELYRAAVIAARDPFFYASLGVPDTLDGRFDILSIYAFLLVQRLQAEPPNGPELAQALFDAMFRSMEVMLRELGVGDPSVPKRMREMWKAFHGRSIAYRAALEATTLAPLEAALARNVWRGSPSPNGPGLLAHLMLEETGQLASQSVASLMLGQIKFLAPASLSAKVESGLPSPD